MAEAQATLDEGLEYLQRFCGVLSTTSAGLQRSAETLEELRTALQQHEATVRERGEAVRARLESALQEVDEASRAATEEVSGLGEAARDLEQEGLGPGDERLQQEAAACEQRVAAARAGLDKELGELAEAGFATLASRLGEVEGELAQAGGEVEGALDELRAGCDDLAERAASVAAEVRGALEATRGELASAQQAVEQGGAELAVVWDELESAMQARCTAVAEPLVALYDAWRGELEALGEELMTGVAEALQQTAAALLEETGQALAAAAEAATGGRLAGLAAELERLAPVTADGEQAADESSSMVDDLVVARRVVTEVDELLDALQVE